jgi:hypothetical protein
MDKTKFRLKVAGVALLLASSIAIVLVVARRPQMAAAQRDVTELRVSHK